MSELTFRFAQPEDCRRILDFVHTLAEYEKMADQVVADEATLREWIFEKGKAPERVEGDLAGILIERARKLAEQKAAK